MIDALNRGIHVCWLSIPLPLLNAGTSLATEQIFYMHLLADANVGDAAAA